MKKNILIITGLLIAVFLGAYFALETSNVDASSLDTSYKSYLATTAVATGTSTPIVLSGSGVLHAVVFASSSVTTVGNLKFYDATSTQATTTANTRVIFSQTAASGAYPLDLEFYNGLKMDVPTGFTGSFVVTYIKN